MLHFGIEIRIENGLFAPYAESQGHESCGTLKRDDRQPHEIGAVLVA